MIPHKRDIFNVERVSLQKFYLEILEFSEKTYVKKEYLSNAFARVFREIWQRVFGHFFGVELFHFHSIIGGKCG